MKLGFRLCIRMLLPRLILFFSIATFSTEFAVAQSSFADRIPISTESEIEFIETWLEKAVRSNNDTDLAAGILLAEAHDSQISSIDFLEQATNTDTTEISLIASLLTHCNTTPRLSSCNLDKLGNSLKELDPENAYPYVLTSLILSNNGDKSGALSELKQALSKNTFDDYVIPRAELLINKLNDIDYPKERLIEQAFLWGGDNFAIVYQGLLELCEGNTPTSLDWKSTCRQLGELMEDYGRTFIAVRIGLGIQRSLYSFDPADERLLNAVQRRRAFTHRWRVLLTQNYGQLLDAGHDEYFNDQIEVDEIYAINEAFQREAGTRDPDSFLNRNSR